jgi:ubiquinone/menaquinone biosynthesis C-methylase UbiE
LVQLPPLDAAEREEYKRQQREWHDSHYKAYNPPLLRAGQAEHFYRTFELQLAATLLKDSGFSTANKHLRVLFSCIGCGEGLPFWLDQFPIQEVVGVDLSVEACRLARRIISGSIDRSSFIQADAEALPFPDESFDLAIVHNGLHHLTNPAAGLRELWRVSRGAVIAIEPADSKLMPLYIKLGIARSHEDSGNEVLRFTKEDYLSFLGHNGDAQMFYRRYFWYEHPFLCDKLLPRLDHSSGRALTRVALSAVNALFFFMRTKSTAVIVKPRKLQSTEEKGREERESSRQETVCGTSHSDSKSVFFDDRTSIASRDTGH